MVSLFKYIWIAFMQRFEAGISATEADDGVDCGVEFSLFILLSDSLRELSLSMLGISHCKGVIILGLGCISDNHEMSQVEIVLH